METVAVPLLVGIAGILVRHSLRSRQRARWWIAGGGLIALTSAGLLLGRLASLGGWGGIWAFFLSLTAGVVAVLICVWLVLVLPRWHKLASLAFAATTALVVIDNVLVDKTRAFISIGSGILGGLDSGVLIPFVILIFASRAWPSPQPYPGASVTTDEALGASGWHYRTRSYTITLSMGDLQQYYDQQMSRYCRDEWQFESSDDPGYVDCLEASCSIRPENDVDPQEFAVYLCSANATQIRVTQRDMWDFD